MEWLSAIEDVLVVGAGVYGAALAWYLATAGHTVTIIEASSAGSGASGGPGYRGVRSNGRHPYDLPLASLSLRLWPGLADTLGGDTGFSRIGSLQVYEEEFNANVSGFASAKHRVAVQMGFGVQSVQLTAKEVIDMEPCLDPAAVLGAVYCPDDGVADHYATTRSLMAAARRHGARVMEGTRVVGFRSRHNRVVGALLDDGGFEPVRGTLAILANTGTPELVMSLAGRPLPVWSMHPQMLFAHTLEPITLNRLLGHDSRRLAVKRLSDDRLMISGGWAGNACASGLKRQDLPNNARKNYEAAVALIPSLNRVAAFDLDGSRAESVSLDGIPIVDRLADAPNTFIGTGWSGHGFAISLAVTKLLANWIATGNQPFELKPLSMNRLGPAYAQHVSRWHTAF